MVLNDDRGINNKSSKFSDLREGDRVELECSDSLNGTNHQVISLRAWRDVRIAGTLTEIKDGSLRIFMDSLGTLDLPFAENCVVTLNEDIAKPSDLRSGDALEIVHDGRIKKVQARRKLADSAREAEVRHETKSPEAMSKAEPPPRSSMDFREKIVILLEAAKRTDPDPELVRVHFDDAKRLAPGRPEPELAFALVLLKANKNLDEAFGLFENARLKTPDLLVSYQGSIWAQFGNKKYSEGLEVLSDLVTNLPKSQGASEPDRDARLIFDWAGKLREFAALAKESKPRSNVLKKVDDAVKEHGIRAIDSYEEARQKVQSKMDILDQEIAKSKKIGNTSLFSDMQKERKQLEFHAEFDFKAAILTVEKLLKK